MEDAAGFDLAFDGELKDIFDLQDQITSSVVGALAPKLEQAEIEHAKRKPTESLNAYDCHMRGMAGLLQRLAAGLPLIDGTIGWHLPDDHRPKRFRCR
jgi:hypothetical protein